MKKLTTFTGLMIAALAATALVACGKSDSGSPTPAPAPTALAIPSGVKVGFFAQNTKWDSIYQNGGSSMTIQSGYKDVLKYAMRTCDRNYSDGGLADCSSWMSGFNDILLFANGSQASKVQLVIRSMPDTSCQNPYYCSNYWYSLPSFQQVVLGLFGFNTLNGSNLHNPLAMDMTIWPINDSKGFELRGYAPRMDGYAGSGNLLFQFQVANGKLEDQSWDYQLIFNGNPAASGRMVRCSTANCQVTNF